MTEKRIEDMRKEHPGEWLLIEVRTVDRREEAATGILLGHSRNKQDIIDLVRKTKAPHLYVTYARDPLEPEPVVML